MNYLETLTKDELIEVIGNMNKKSKKKAFKASLLHEEHNSFLELIYQFNTHKQELHDFKCAIVEREQHIDNFLTGIANRYPKLKDYVGSLQ